MQRKKQETYKYDSLSHIVQTAYIYALKLELQNAYFLVQHM